MTLSSIPLLVLLVSSSLICTAQSSQPGTIQTGEIRGQVTYADGRPATLGLAVYLDIREGGGSDQTQTDRQGKFDFRQVLMNHVYTVRVRAPGYLSEAQEVDLLTMGMAYVNIVLRVDPKSSPASAPGAMGSLSAADAGAPDNARKDLESGRDLLNQGKEIDKSLEFFQKAVTEYPKYAQAYLLMGIAYSTEAKWDEAQKSLQKAIELDKANAAAYVALGAAQNQQKDYAGAEKSLLQAVTLAPESADAQFELGNTYWGLQRWTDADQHVAKANTLRPDNAGQHILMGNIKLRERDAQSALAEYKEALRISPNGPFAPSAQQMVSKIEAALAAAKK